MATKPKDSNSKSVVGNKEKKTLSSNSPITTTKRTTRPSSASAVESSTTSTEKQIPNYLKPTLSSQPRSQSFKLTRNDNAPNIKPHLNRRRSFDKPPSPSKLPKQIQQSPSKLQNKVFVRSRSTIPSSKPNLERVSPKTTKQKNHCPVSPYR
jgi:hypothetical protein